MAKDGKSKKVIKKSCTYNTEEMTFDELVEFAANKIHSALLVGGGNEMKQTLHIWMEQAIIWQRGQE